MRHTADSPFRWHPLAWASLVALTTLAGVCAQAQPAPQTVEVVGVSPLPGTDVPKEAVPAHAQTARAADLERAQALDLSSFLNRRMGSVFVNDVQNNPLQPDLNYRGFTASPLLGSAQGLSVDLDGVRLNQPFGDVVSWDLVPKSAIASIVLNPGSNPLFGLNTLGGALSVQTKDGKRHAGTAAQVTLGSNERWLAEFEHGGSRADGTHWFVTGSHFDERGWRQNSPSKAGQLFSKLGTRVGETELTLTAALAETRLNGNGLQEQRLLSRDHSSVYTQPDTTRNRSALFNLAFSRPLAERWTLSGNLYARQLRTRTYNGDLNDDSLDQATYQPNATERAALTAAGFTGFPVSGESAANTPFPKWRCIANALLRDEPGEKCNGVINQTATRQSNHGFSLQFNHQGALWGYPAQSLLGVAMDASRSHFTQGSELGYLNPDHSVTGVGAFGDGVTGGDVDGVPYDTRVDLSGRTRTWSAFFSSVLKLSPGTHLTVSGRYNRNSVSNRDAITPGAGPGSLEGDHRFSRFNPALGLTFTPVPGVNAWAGVGQGSRSPSSIELGCADPANPCKLPNAFAGDPPLKQVVTTTIEAGLRGGAPGRLTWNVGVFRSDNKDDLLFVADDTTGFGYFKNFGKTRRQGLEAGISLPLARDLVVSAQYTHLDATYRSAEEVNGSSNSSNDAAQSGFPGVEGTIDIHPGDRIPLVPRQLLKVSVDWDPVKALSLGAEVLAVGRSLARGNENGQHQPDGTYYLGQGHSPGYSVVNLNAAYQAARGLKVFVQVHNLFDRRYSTAAQLGPAGFDANGNYVARPFAANANGDRPLVHSTFLAPGAPRSVAVGLRYAF